MEHKYPKYISAKEASEYVAIDGEWMLHFFNFVDDFRNTKDSKMVEDALIETLDPKFQALLASIVCTLCDELKIKIPAWAFKTQWLKCPWFVSGIENLKAMAISESPIYFRRNNIWVLDNFLSRA